MKLPKISWIVSVISIITALGAGYTAWQNYKDRIFQDGVHQAERVEWQEETKKLTEELNKEKAERIKNDSIIMNQIDKSNEIIYQATIVMRMFSKQLGIDLSRAN